VNQLERLSVKQNTTALSVSLECHERRFFLFPEQPFWAGLKYFPDRNRIALDQVSH